MNTLPDRPALTLLTALTAVGAAALLAACGQPPRPPVPPATTPQVGYVVAQPQRLPVQVEMPGRTTPVLVADVRPQVNGIVQSRLFKEGGDVKAGQVLYQIDPATYAATVDSAKAALARAEATTAAAQVKARRTDELLAIKAVSAQDADDARVALQQAQADELSARASLDTARIDLARTRITAPIGGRVGRSAVTPGALVTANQTTALATVQKLDPINVDLTQSSGEVLRLKRQVAEGKLAAGQARVSLLFDDGTRYALPGTLKFTEVSVEQSTGAVTLRAEFPNPRGELLPGMYVRAVVEVGTVDDAMLLPQQAVSRDATGNAFAWVVSSDRRLEKRAVTTTRTVGTQWLLGSGVNPGDRVAVVGMGNVKAGQEVEARPYTAPPAGAASAPTKLASN